MLYHVSVALDNSEHDLIVGQIVCSPSTQETTPTLASNEKNNASDAAVPGITELDSTAPVTENATKDKLVNSKYNQTHNSTSVSKENQAKDENPHGDLNNIKEKRKDGKSSYALLNSSSESVSRLAGHESPSGSSELARSSSITSSLSRSTSGFSADSSSLGGSESVSLDAIYNKNSKGNSDMMNTKLLDEEENPCDNFSSVNRNEASSLQRGVVVSNALDYLSDKSGVDGDIDSVCTNNTSPLSPMSNSGSSDLSDEANSPSTIRQVLDAGEDTSGSHTPVPTYQCNNPLSKNEGDLTTSSSVAYRSSSDQLTVTNAPTTSSHNNSSSSPNDTQLHQRVRSSGVDSDSISLNNIRDNIVRKGSLTESSDNEDAGGRVPNVPGSTGDEKTGKAHNE